MTGHGRLDLFAEGHEIAIKANPWYGVLLPAPNGIHLTATNLAYRDENIEKGEADKVPGFLVQGAKR